MLALLSLFILVMMIKIAIYTCKERMLSRSISWKKSSTYFVICPACSFSKTKSPDSAFQTVESAFILSSILRGLSDFRLAALEPCLLILVQILSFKHLKYKKGKILII